MPILLWMLFEKYMAEYLLFIHNQKFIKFLMMFSQIKIVIFVLKFLI